MKLRYSDVKFTKIKVLVSSVKNQEIIKFIKKQALSS